MVKVIELLLITFYYYYYYAVPVLLLLLLYSQRDCSHFLLRLELESCRVWLVYKSTNPFSSFCTASGTIVVAFASHALSWAEFLLACCRHHSLWCKSAAASIAAPSVAVVVAAAARTWPVHSGNRFVDRGRGVGMLSGDREEAASIGVIAEWECSLCLFFSPTAPVSRLFSLFCRFWIFLCDGRCRSSRCGFLSTISSTAHFSCHRLLWVVIKRKGDAYKSSLLYSSVRPGMCKSFVVFASLVSSLRRTAGLRFRVLDRSQQQKKASFWKRPRLPLR